MLTNEQARARVAKGAAFLDRTRPGWHDRIDVGTLTLHDPCGCIVGQLCDAKPERIGRQYYFSEDQHREMGLTLDEIVTHGMDLAAFECNLGVETHEEFDVLQDAWIEAIADRRLRSQEAHEQPVTVAAVAGTRA